MCALKSRKRPTTSISVPISGQMQTRSALRDAAKGARMMDLLGETRPPALARKVWVARSPRINCSQRASPQQLSK
eukprot:8694282-Alexandrium_andersonii.AAC.1